MNYYNTGELIEGYYKCVVPMEEPIEQDYIYGARDRLGEVYDQTDSQYYKDIEVWHNHLPSLPTAALTKIEKKGWMENVIETCFIKADDGRWAQVSKDVYYLTEREKRIILVPKKGNDVTSDTDEELMSKKKEQSKDYYIAFGVGMTPWGDNREKVSITGFRMNEKRNIHIVAEKGMKVQQIEITTEKAVEMGLINLNKLAELIT